MFSRKFLYFCWCYLTLSFDFLYFCPPFHFDSTLSLCMCTNISFQLELVVWPPDMNGCFWVAKGLVGMYMQVRHTCKVLDPVQLWSPISDLHPLNPIMALDFCAQVLGTQSLHYCIWQFTLQSYQLYWALLWTSLCIWLTLPVSPDLV